MPKILIVDDEQDILELLEYNFVREGFKTIKAKSGEEALKKAINHKPDLILLDLMLPGLNGLEITRQLKSNFQTTSIPIIMLTAKGEESDIIVGLELGADDYITKPFSPKILIARIRAIIRRMNNHANNKEKIQFDDLLIHCGMRAVFIKDTPIYLTFSEFQILYFLAIRPGWVFTRPQIVDAVRGNDYNVTDRSVDVQIAGLRKKLGPWGKYIETVRGVGYRFRKI